MPVDHPDHLRSEATRGRHQRKLTFAIAFLVTLTGLWVLGRVVDIGGLLA